MSHSTLPRTTSAFVAAAWASLVAGALAFIVGLMNSGMPMHDRYYYFTVLLFGLYAGVSLQKAVRDRLEGVPVTGIYYGLSWTAVCAAIALLSIGLFTANLAASEKGFFAMSFVLTLFAAVAVQKNIRDAALDAREEHRFVEQKHD